MLDGVTKNWLFDLHMDPDLLAQLQRNAQLYQAMQTNKHLQELAKNKTSGSDYAKSGKKKQQSKEQDEAVDITPWLIVIIALGVLVASMVFLYRSLIS